MRQAAMQLKALRGGGSVMGVSWLLSRLGMDVEGTKG